LQTSLKTVDFGPGGTLSVDIKEKEGIWKGKVGPK